MPTRPRRSVWVVAVGVVLAVCLAASAACVASQSFILRLPVPFGYLMTVCGVYQTQPKFQLGLVWTSPYISSVIPPFGGPAAGCFTIPWAPWLPQRGSLLAP
jgi:hypothetical protein